MVDTDLRGIALGRWARFAVVCRIRAALYLIMAAKGTCFARRLLYASTPSDTKEISDLERTGDCVGKSGRGCGL
jgi:hypothetical protein